eukprot:3650305-Amphidinium_carterae.1
MQHDSWNTLLQAVRTIRSCTLHSQVFCCGYMVRANFPIPSAAACSSTCSRRSTPSATSSTDMCSDPIAYWLRYLYEQAASVVAKSADAAAPATPVSSVSAVPALTATAAPSAFPTDAALRHRLTTQERRLRRQPRLQEAHYDDCGSDFESLLAPQVEATDVLDPPSLFFVFMAHAQTWLASRLTLQQHSVRQCLSIPLTAQCKANKDMLEATYCVPQ